MKYSVIIPVLNEAGMIERRIAHVRSLNPDAEIIVADGGSIDDTPVVAGSLGAVVLCSGPGRGVQCNAGAAAAGGDVLVFLHADTALPPDAFALLDRSFTDERVNIGTFRLSFDIEHWLLKLYCIPCDFDLSFTRFGDQCIVIRKSFFHRLGGFPDWRLYEDLGLINRARKVTRIHRFPGKVKTSARRFLLNGVARQQLRNMWYTLLYFLGVHPDRLAERYARSAGRRNAVSLGVFARFPRPGKVKSRLARTVGEAKAAGLYRICAERAFHGCGKLASRARLYLFLDDARDIERGIGWAGPRFDVLAQSGIDLGERLTRAAATMFGKGARRVLLLASDVPDISKRIIKEAVEALETHDVVIGPCYDGGYYLVGMKRPRPELFSGVAWGTGKVLAQTLNIVGHSGLSVYQLRTLIDIDTGEDLERWLDSRPARTRGILKGMAEKATA